jgi:7-carboxy-7-deazaguanine synthase
MFGNNPIRPPLSHDGSMLEVQSIFATIQGEGPYVGWPSIFLRLGGCNLACSFCDTEFESFKPMSLTEIIASITGLAGSARSKRTHNLVVITGGEPLRQNIVPLCEQLLELEFAVQIETNGTLWRPLPEAAQVVCSPKNTGRGYFPVRADVLARAQALKFIVSQESADYNHVADVGQSAYPVAVYVQPMDEQDEKRNAENLAFAMDLARKHGYRLSLQTHKLLGIE